MIAQQTLRGRQRRLRQQDQYTAPLRHTSEEQTNLLQALRVPLNRALCVVRIDQYELTVAHCDSVEQTLADLDGVVKRCLDVLSGPELSVKDRPYALLGRMSILSRLIREACVLTTSVRGQCRAGRLHTDPTGAYWHLRTHLHTVVTVYEEVIGGLKQYQSHLFEPYEAGRM